MNKQQKYSRSSLYFDVAKLKYSFNWNLNLILYLFLKTCFLFSLKSVHFKETVTQSSFLSKLWYFSIPQVPQFWKKWGSPNCLLKMNRLYINSRLCKNYVLFNPTLSKIWMSERSLWKDPTATRQLCNFVEERNRAGKIVFRGNYLRKYSIWLLRLWFYL